MSFAGYARANGQSMGKRQEAITIVTNMKSWKLKAMVK